MRHHSPIPPGSLSAAAANAELPPAVCRRQGHLTAEDYIQLPACLHPQLLEGYILTERCKTPLHQSIITELLYQIVTFIKETHSPYKAVTFPVQVRPYKEDCAILIPDVALLCHPEKLCSTAVHIVPLFVAEVVSSCTEYVDHITKKELYRQWGVKEYWIISPETRTIYSHNFTAGPEIQTTFHTFSERISVFSVKGLFLDLQTIP